MSHDLASLTEGLTSRSFTGVEAASILDLSYRQLDHWVTLTGDMNTGSGHPRSISLALLQILAIVKEMRLVGIPLSDAIADAVEVMDSDLNVAQWSPSPNTHVSIDVETVKEEVVEMAFNRVVAELENDIPGRTRRFH